MKFQEQLAEAIERVKAKSEDNIILLNRMIRSDRELRLKNGWFAHIFALARISHKLLVKGGSMFVSDWPECDEVIFINIAEEHFSVKMSKQTSRFAVWL